MHVHKSVIYKEELEWSDLFSLQKLLSFPSTKEKKNAPNISCLLWLEKSSSGVLKIEQDN